MSVRHPRSTGGEIAALENYIWLEWPLPRLSRSPQASCCTARRQAAGFGKADGIGNEVAVFVRDNALFGVGADGDGIPGLGWVAERGHLI
jgi:hypothetical protein